MSGGVAERADTGAAALPCASELYARARRVRELATIAMEASVARRPEGRDSLRAARLLDEIAAIARGEG